MINLKEIRIFGFGSIDDLVYRLDMPGINVISGENGVGKSTIGNALYWAVTGKKLKPNSSINTWEHLQEKGYKGTKVELDFDNYTIIRCNNYKGKVGDKPGKNKVFLFEGKKEVEKNRDVDDVNKAIIKLMGYTAELFKTAIILGQNMTRLIEEDGPTKKKIFEETFDIFFIQKAKDIATKKLSLINTEYSKLEADISASLALETTMDKHILTLMTIQDNYEGNYKKDLKGLRKEIQDIKNKIEAIPPIPTKLIKVLKNLTKAIESTSTKINNDLVSAELKMNFNINTQKSTIEAYDLKIQNLKNEFFKMPKRCSQCRQKLAKKEIQAYKKKIEQDLAETKIARFEKVEQVDKLEKEYKVILLKVEEQRGFDEKVKVLKRKLETKKELMASIERRRASLAPLNVQLKVNKKRLKNLKEEYNNRVTNNKTLDDARDELMECQTTLHTQKQEIKKVEKKRNAYQWLMNDALSNSGLKAFIMDSMFNRINRNLNKYAPLIGFKVVFGVDMNSARKDLQISILRKGNVVSYSDLSGGQKQLVDVVSMFAIHDSIQGTKPINCLFLDEPFERLTDKNIEIVSEIIQNKAITKSVHLIHHQKGFQPIASKTTHLKLSKKGITDLAA